MVLISAMQHHNHTFGFLWLFLLHHFCFLLVYLLTPQPSAVLPKYTSCLFCFCEQTDVSCWLLSVQKGWKLHSGSVSGHCCCIFFPPFESCFFFFLLAWDTSREAHYLRITAWKDSSLEALLQSFLDCVLLCTLLGTGTPCSSSALPATCRLL